MYVTDRQMVKEKNDAKGMKKRGKGGRVKFTKEQQSGAYKDKGEREF